MLTWIYRKFETDENLTNNATLWITKGTDEEAEQMEKQLRS